MSIITGSSMNAKAAGQQTLAMGTCYALGVFNDNFFKQATLLLAATASLTGFQGQATLLFALPFVLFSAGAGWLADQRAKKKVIVWAKTLELTAMLVGAWGMVTLQWPWLLGMVFCMGLSSTLFSPALNGSIPELFAVRDVPRINALFKLVTTAAILTGIALAGFALDQHWMDTAQPFGQWLVAIVAVGAALVGLAVTPWMRSIPPATDSEKSAHEGHQDHSGPRTFPRSGPRTFPRSGPRTFPWSGPVESFRDLKAIRKDPPLLVTVTAEAYFYFLSTMLILLITNLGRAQLGLSYSATSALSVALLGGICAGALLAARGTPTSWLRWLVPSLMAIGVLLIGAAKVPALPVPLHMPVLLGVYTLAGCCGGLYLIPLTSFTQLRPAATDRGRILGASNCLTFTGIIVAGQLYPVLALVTPSAGHAVMGGLTLVVAGMFAWGIRRLPNDISSTACHAQPEHPKGAGVVYRAALACVRALLGLRYRVRVEGLAAIDEATRQEPDRPVLFLPNHPALVDPLLVYTQLAAHYCPRPLADKEQLDRPLVRSIAGLARPVLIPDMRGGAGSRAAREALRAGIAAVEQALQLGECVLMYPAGALSRDGLEKLGGNSGVRNLLRAQPRTRVVLVRTRGLWGSSLSWASGQAPELFSGALNGLWTLLRFGSGPRRKVHILLQEDHQAVALAQSGDSRALNSYLELFYNDETARPSGTVS